MGMAEAAEDLTRSLKPGMYFFYPLQDNSLVYALR